MNSYNPARRRSVVQILGLLALLLFGVNFLTWYSHHRCCPMTRPHSEAPVIDVVRPGHIEVRLDRKELESIRKEIDAVKVEVHARALEQIKTELPEIHIKVPTPRIVAN